MTGALLAGTPVLAQSHTEAVVERLRRLGYKKFRIRRTFLGFDQIFAEGPSGSREIVLNPRTGLIKRDYSYAPALPAGTPVPDEKAENPPASKTTPPKEDQKPSARSPKSDVAKSGDRKP